MDVERSKNSVTSEGGIVILIDWNLLIWELIIDIQHVWALKQVWLESQKLTWLIRFILINMLFYGLNFNCRYVTNFLLVKRVSHELFKTWPHSRVGEEAKEDEIKEIISKVILDPALRSGSIWFLLEQIKRHLLNPRSEVSF